MSLILERLQPSAAISDKDGKPTPYFTTFMQTLCQALEANDAANDEATEALAAQLALIEAAQATADAVHQTDAISASYTVPSSVLSAADAGTDATITIAAHTRKYGDGTSLSVAGGSLTALAYSTPYAVYYDDPTRADTTPAYVATTIIANAQFNVASGRHFVGTVTTPAAAGPPTSGGGSPPGGGGPIP